MSQMCFLPPPSYFKQTLPTSVPQTTQHSLSHQQALHTAFIFPQINYRLAGPVSSDDAALQRFVTKIVVDPASIRVDVELVRMAVEADEIDLLAVITGSIAVARTPRRRRCPVPGIRETLNRIAA